ncbi:Tyrosine-protein phosphatase Lar [Nymphon striatum]|nr:Tyrosine-protein phosphatase Lar [Nymphon striatum]
MCPGCTNVWVRDLCNNRYPVEKIGECPTQYGKKDPRYPPKIVKPLKSQSVTTGNVVSFVCIVSGNPPPQIEWRKNGKEMSSSRHMVIKMPQGSVLRIEPVREGRDEAEYECHADNDVGRPVTSTAMLSIYGGENLNVVIKCGDEILSWKWGFSDYLVLSKFEEMLEKDYPDNFPVIIKHPDLKGEEKGRVVVLPCEAAGNPTPKISWFKDFIPVDMSNPRMTLLDGGSLQIVNAQLEDQGRYECVAENEFGTANSHMATLYVRVRRVPPYFSIPPDKVYEVVPGSSLNISCVAVGSPMPYVKWRKGAIDLTPEDSTPVGKNILRLESIQESANYTCIASSTLGPIEATTQVLVQALPRAPTNVRISDVTATSMRLTWSYDIDRENILYYVIQYKLRDANQVYSEMSGITTTFHDITDLIPYKEYEFYIIAVNAIGRGLASDPVYGTTGESKPGSSPRNVHARPLSSTTVVIEWEVPEKPHGQITGYKVYFTTNPNLPLQSWNDQMVDNNLLTTISDLTPHTVYTIRVKAFTVRGSGPPSAPVQVKTQQGVPSQPLNLKSVSRSSNSISLQWDHPLHSGEHIISYEIYWNDSFSHKLHHKSVSVTQNYKLTNLYPNTIYRIWVAAKSLRGEGAASPPIQVETKEYATSKSLLSHLIHLSLRGKPPIEEKRHGVITYYKLRYSRVSKGKLGQKHEFTASADKRSYIIDNLQSWTEYKVWMLAGTAIGDGPPSVPILVKTFEHGVWVGNTMYHVENFAVLFLDCLSMLFLNFPSLFPGEPHNVTSMAINSTTVKVMWQAPDDKEQNGVIYGYQIHVQEVNDNGDLIRRPLRYDTGSGKVRSFNVTGLQPDTIYEVQVSAVNKKGDGKRSKRVRVKTPGGVPNKPDLNIHFGKQDPYITVELKWTRPTEVYGRLLGYRLRYGKVDEKLDTQEMSSEIQQKTIRYLDRGVKYEFRVAGKNGLGYGQEAIKHLQTPEGIPTAAPMNITYELQSPNTVVLRWDQPSIQYRNGRIVKYFVQFYKSTDESSRIERNISLTRTVFGNLDVNTEYIYRIKAFTKQGGGPFSEKMSVHTPSKFPISPANVNAMPTSKSTVEVWWDAIESDPSIIGYRVFYVKTAVQDLEKWKKKDVGLTSSAEIGSLDSNAVYAIRVAGKTENGLGLLSNAYIVTIEPNDLDIPKKTIKIDPDITSIVLKDLQPFTSYNVNVTAVPRDETYRAPVKLVVTTGMAAPKPLIKPDFYGVRKGRDIGVIFSQASEEYGPISHYLVVVVPVNRPTKPPDSYSIDELTLNTLPDVSDNINSSSPNAIYPYIAAKYFQHDIPYTWFLGDGEQYSGFLNRRLAKKMRYKIFIRAIVDTQQKTLFTSSPFSDPLSLEMPSVPSGELPSRPHDGERIDMPDVSQIGNQSENKSLIWIVGPIIAILIAICIAIYVIMRRRKRYPKAPADATTKPLMSDLTAHPCDPVEMRRLNFQTPAMISHPPIPIADLSAHIDRLKANDNLKFSHEYESIEPGQQFTWENSNLEVNKPKNRYANVIAYDHSRVVLQNNSSIPGTDYINANFCDGYRKQNAYIATQGPLPETFKDFWKLVWEQRSATIVMMTKLEERSRVKCDQYWPARGSDSYGDVTITLKDVQDLATYCIRTFQLSKEGFKDFREVKQFQFTAWPDHGVPDHPTPFLMFLRRVRAINPSEAGPMVVHCSAGVGRTGAFIVIDSMLERIRHEKSVDIYGHVTCLRAQRNYMVQTEDQYIFIHDALLEAVIASNTEITARNLFGHIQKLSQMEPNESVSGMELEFKKLASVKAQPSRFASANLPVNKFKNRLVNILPFESTRVCLQPIRGVDGSDYINASFIDGYRYRNAYVATQGPLIETTDDFWRMLWEHNSTIIVMLTKLKEMGREKCHAYWPSERSARYQYFVVDPIAEYNMPQYIMREFKVTDAREGETRTIRQFQYTDWPDSGVPKSGDGFIDFIGQVHKTKEQFGQNGPISVHCSAGVGRTGVFITLSIVLERMQYEGVVDMFQTVRTLRTQRPCMVQTDIVTKESKCGKPDESWSSNNRDRCFKVGKFLSIENRRMLKISYTEHRTNEFVLRKIEAKRSLMNTIKKRKCTYFGHLMRKEDGLQRLLLEGKIHGGRGRPRTAWYHNIKEWTGMR